MAFCSPFHICMYCWPVVHECGESDNVNAMYVLSMFSALKIRVWMDGPRSGIIPDVVEQEAGNFYRTLYKLEKVFNDNPAPKKIASKVCILFV